MAKNKHSGEESAIGYSFFDKATRAHEKDMLAIDCGRLVLPVLLGNHIGRGRPGLINSKNALFFHR